MTPIVTLAHRSIDAQLRLALVARGVSYDAIDTAYATVEQELDHLRAADCRIDYLLERRTAAN